MEQEAKPWTNERRTIASTERNFLASLRSDYQAMIEQLDKEITKLTTVIGDSYPEGVNKTPQANPSYGRTDSPLDFWPEPEKMSVAGIIRNFRKNGK